MKKYKKPSKTCSIKHDTAQHYPNFDIGQIAQEINEREKRKGVKGINYGDEQVVLNLIEKIYSSIIIKRDVVRLSTGTLKPLQVRFWLKKSGNLWESYGSDAG